MRDDELVPWLEARAREHYRAGNPWRFECREKRLCRLCLVRRMLWGRSSAEPLFDHLPDNEHWRTEARLYAREEVSRALTGRRR